MTLFMSRSDTGDRWLTSSLPFEVWRKERKKDLFLPFRIASGEQGEKRISHMVISETIHRIRWNVKHEECVASVREDPSGRAPQFDTCKPHESRHRRSVRTVHFVVSTWP